VLSVMVNALGLSSALTVIGIITVAAMVASGLWFRQLGGDTSPPPDHVVTRVVADPVFEHVGGPAAARLAERINVVRAEVGDVIITEGEPGDRYYLIVDGSVVVTIRGDVVSTMGAGESFGEIALLRDVPRTATVTCITPVELFAVSRDDFLATVTGHPRSLAAATSIAKGLLKD
jgi:CRP-like cAMP-binding protein